jgi:hypothetical protein
MSASDHLSQRQFSSSLAEGHEPDADGRVTLYHRTRTEQNAANIRDFGFHGSTNSVDRGEVYFSSHADRSPSYGAHVIPVRVPANHPYIAHGDTLEHPDGTEEHWYSMPADKIKRKWIQ